jgi:hypothetical protein
MRSPHDRADPGPTVDIWPLAENGRIERGTPAFVLAYMLGDDFAGLATDPGQPVSAAPLRRPRPPIHVDVR